MSKTQSHIVPLRILFIEDVENDALLLADHLQSEGLVFDWQRIDTEHDIIAKLQESWDIIFSDFSMPHLSGARALEIVRQHDLDIPFIFISGAIGEDIAVEAMKCGAQDYIMKENLSRLLPAVDRELREAQQRRERRQAEQILRKLSLVVKQATDSVIITNSKGYIEYVNPAFEKLTGYTTDEIKGNTPATLSSGKHDIAFYQQLWQTIIHGEIFKGTLVNRRKNGELFYEEQVITPLKDTQGCTTHFVSTGRDITARVHAEEAHARLVSILEATPDLVAIFELDGCLRYLNGAGRQLLGLDAEEDVNVRCIQDFFLEGTAQQQISQALTAVHQYGVWNGESVLRVSKNIGLPVSQVILAHRNTEGSIEYLSTIMRDISERKHFEAELQHQTTHDRLTNLPNRFFLIDRFTSALEYARRHGVYVAVLFLDLDNFKRVNDSLGHAAGDVLLQRVAQRLKGCLRSNDTVARHGGDEFTIVASDLEDSENVLAVLHKLHTAFERPVIVSSQEIYITFSIGIAIYPHDGDQIEDLLHHADVAMYQAKSSGPNQYRFYASDMNARGHELLALEADLRRALEHEEFLLHYQPQMDLRTNRITGVEGLIRWQHPVRGLLSPADFVPLLENSGMIIPVGEWVLRQACKEHRIWREAGFDDVRVSINVSAAQFNDAHLLAKVRRTLQDEQMPQQAFELEITENILMQDPVNAVETLRAIHALGVRIAIDDFGTGYSSLAYLKRFPLDVLKIDQTFVSDLANSPGDVAIVEASISLAHKFGLEVIAEGVETAKQFEFMRTHNCDVVQGYYLSQPLPRVELIKLLQKNNNISRKHA
ncbi:EAL domain-containing protein [Nitrosomonas ureae]|uniref:Response regulator receiver modulated diguanylate cyclase/phosphodiesterase with PAS/PAC sensor n=1 Tax=Nitrosomonas ureae TaxID=44577 RepID=A0A2T5IED3_9PROT|nr:EAL domain-containing protein [Nitrosomonas ureae]PTQ82192.1 response regulator receiver modulated diguanylate cyclase/phosphodiesterase with PAS/PAC sensor [Nitrosomonas ureae]PXX17618.1 response regulator receiver modulated diguanylate cyclase/phosphodiesterase with PAS/PAC sensor [Nitrosomonas ureae]